MIFGNPRKSNLLCRDSVILVLLILPLYGCSVQESCLEKNFPPEFVSKAHSDFKFDITAWDILSGQTIPTRARLVFHCESSVNTDVQAFCQQKLINNLNARGFELDPNEPAELIVCIVKASEIRSPVRIAKVRIAAKLSAKENANPIVLGIADGIEPRPDLSQGVSMPKASYFRAAQQAISKLIHQLDNMPKTTLSPR